jgi:phosphoglucosamine mutase
MFRLLSADGAAQPYTVALEPRRELLRDYLSFLRRAFGQEHNLAGKKVVLDCATGSASAMAAEVFSGLGIDVKILSAEPDGRNINLGCGSLHLEVLQRAVPEAGADLGIAFDGDADRALFVTATGEIVNGDGVLLAAGRYMKRLGKLGGDVVVGTVMSNLGLEHALAAEGLRLLRTPVGDKYVLEEMLRCGANLGGEQSGHIIFRALATTGDGLLTALQMLRIMSDERKSLSELVDGLKIFPQTIRNIRVREKIPLEQVPQVMEQIRASEKHLGTSGRVLVRYSGTEPLARVMVEAASADDVESSASAIVAAIEQSIGLKATVKA